MNVPGVLKTAFSALAALFGFLKDRQLIGAGKAEQQRDDLLEHRKRVKKADRAWADNDRIVSLRARRFRD